jgi:protein transport protein SEC61 subunit gamma-like protein
MDEQIGQTGRWWRFKRFAKECFRVLKVTKKPDRSEFTTIVKVSGLGIAVIGLIGFVIHLIKVLFVG